MSYDAIVIGAGHNGLVAACHLARAGLRTVVLERRSIAGGAAVTEELCPGFRCPTLAHLVGGLDRRLVRDLELTKHGLAIIEPPVRLAAPAPDGRLLVLYRAPAATARALADLSERDAGRYAEFEGALAAMTRVIREVVTRPPPPLERPTAGDLWRLITTARRFRSLDRTNAYRLLRWICMPAADIAGEWFETDLLQAAVAARGISGAALGPRAAGTGAGVLLQAAIEGASSGAAAFAAGGTGTVTQAIAAAARSAGAKIRTGAGVLQILASDARVKGVVLEDGEEIRAPIVVSGADPKRTLLGLLEPAALDPQLRHRLGHYRCEGRVAKLNLALSDLPRLAALRGASGNLSRELLAGRIHIGPSLDYLERAFDASKYGAWSERPFLEVTIPTLTDPSLAPPGGHVMSVVAQYAPYRLRAGTWPEQAGAFEETIVSTLETFLPGLRSLVVARQLFTPVDLEERFGLTGGHMFHGEHALDQLFALRPVPGFERYRTPIGGLYLCSAGTHPGGGVTGLPGTLAGRQVLADRKWSLGTTVDRDQVGPYGTPRTRRRLKPGHG